MHLGASLQLVEHSLLLHNIIVKIQKLKKMLSVEWVVLRDLDALRAFLQERGALEGGGG